MPKLLSSKSCSLLSPVLLLLLGGFSSCCNCAPSVKTAPTADQAVAEVALVLDVHQDSQAAFRALDERAQNRAADAAWSQLMATLPPAVTRAMGVRRIAVGVDGWPTSAARMALANAVLRAAGLAEDELPKGCQRDLHPDQEQVPGSIKCDYPLPPFAVPRTDLLPSLRWQPGFSVHCRFLSRNR